MLFDLPKVPKFHRGVGIYIPTLSLNAPSQETVSSHLRKVLNYSRNRNRARPRCRTLHIDPDRFTRIDLCCLHILLLTGGSIVAEDRA